MHNCTCSSAFLLRSVIREMIFGADEWKPLFIGFICSNFPVTSSTKRS